MSLLSWEGHIASRCRLRASIVGDESYNVSVVETQIVDSINYSGDEGEFDNEKLL